MCAASNDKTNIPHREIVTKISNQYHFSIETEFIAACDAGKPILYVRSFLQDLGINQCEAIILHKHNQGALLMANAGQPTKRTRHMDIKDIDLQQWVEQDALLLKRVVTTDNESDLLTNNLSRTLFN